SFAHSGSIRLGPRPISLEHEALRYGAWVRDEVKQIRTTAYASESPRTVLSGKVPPGVAVMFQAAWDRIDDAALEPIDPSAVRGQADFQVSTPTVSFPAGSVSTVMVHAFVRARYTPDTGSAPLPEPIHGEVQ